MSLPQPRYNQAARREAPAKKPDQPRSLLQLLLAEGAYGRREDDRIEIIAPRRGVPVLTGRFTLDRLSPLLSSGAVRCVMEGGRPRFVLTAEGRQAAFRERQGADAFADQHREIVLEKHPEAEGSGQLRRNLREDPLAMLARQERGAFALPASAITAGERLRRDIHMASLQPKVTANWDRLVVDGAGPGHGLQASEVQAAARMRVQRALSAVGPDFSGVLMDLCGFSKGIAEIEQELGLPVRSGKIVLALALRALARHYGLSDVACGPENRSIRQWGTPDHRPEFPR